MRKVVVTGGNGFIGAATTKWLDHLGLEPIVFDRAEGLDVMTDELPKADDVIHLAGMLGTAELFDTAEEAIDVNVHGTLRILDQCRDRGMGYVGITMPDVFPSLYTATKVCAMRIATAYHHAYGVPVSHVRAYNAFGRGQKYGPGHPQKIVPTFATKAWRNELIPVWGDGTQTVDLVHVDDVAKVLIKALDFGDDSTLDAGTGAALSVNEVVDLVLALTESKSKIEYLPMRKGEIETKIVADGEGWDQMGWHPEFRMADLLETVESYQ